MQETDLVTTTYVTGAFQAEALSYKGPGDPIVDSRSIVLHSEE